MVPTARIYCARSKALGSGQFRWLMLPLSCSTESYSCCSIHSRISRSIERRCSMPRAISTEQSIVTSAPAMSILSASVPRWMPLVAARLARIWPCRIAIQRSGRRMAIGVLRRTAGVTSSVSRSMSG